MGGISLKKLKCCSVTQRFCQACGGQSGVSAGRRLRGRAPPQGGSRRTQTSPLPWTLAPPVPPEPDPPPHTRKGTESKGARKSPGTSCSTAGALSPPRGPSAPRADTGRARAGPALPARRPRGAGAAGGSACPDPGPPSLRGRVRSGGHTAPRGPPPRRAAVAQKPIPHFRMK